MERANQITLGLMSIIGSIWVMLYFFKILETSHVTVNWSIMFLGIGLLVIGFGLLWPDYPIQTKKTKK